MKCDDIKKALNSDTYNLEAIEHHLETCPECAKKYADDLKIENALRNLTVETVPVNITDEISDKLSLVNQKRSRLKFIRKWVWISASISGLMLIWLVMPVISGWFAEAFDMFASSISMFSGLISIDINNEIAFIQSSKYYNNIVYLIIISAVMIAVHIWREFKAVIE